MEIRWRRRLLQPCAPPYGVRRQSTRQETRSQSSKLSTDLIESLLPRLIRCYRSSGVGLPVPPKQTVGTMNRVNFLSQSGKPRYLDYVGLHARYSWSKTHSTTVTAVTIPENHLWIFPHWNARCRTQDADAAPLRYRLKWQRYEVSSFFHYPLSFSGDRHR